MHDLLAGLPRPIAIAHRAANDPLSLREAEAIGVDLVEADVWLHGGRLEVRHTKSLRPLPVLWDRWRLVPSWKPRLQLHELLAELAPDTGVMLDLKGGERRLPDALTETLRVDGRTRPVLVCARNWRLVDALDDREELTVMHSMGTTGQLRAHWKHLTSHENHAVSVHRRLLSADVVHVLKQRSSTVVTWPINDERWLAKVLTWGVDGVISDSLPLLREVVEGRGGTVA
jgi:glycerophosphoryl diester phosphodiesterase